MPRPSPAASPRRWGGGPGERPDLPRGLAPAHATAASHRRAPSPTAARARRLCAAVALALVALGPAGASAQVPDSVGVAPALASRPDSLAPRAPTRGLVVPLGPEPGRTVTLTPALTPALDATDALADAPGVFLYRFSAPGRAALSLDGLAPETPALLLDGRPFDDLLTGAPRYDLLPAEALGPLRLADARLGRASAVEASTRPFRVGVPVTELRYFGGQRGVQHASGTHAQTRRPPGWLRGGSDDSRLTLTGHVATRSASGLTGSSSSSSGTSTDGGRERHSHALFRALLTRPGLAVELGELYSEQTDGAQRGLTGSVFSPLRATALDGSADRTTIRNDLWLTTWLGIAASPTEVGVAWTAQRWRYSRRPEVGPRDTLAASARRLSAHLRQRVALGPTRAWLRAGAHYDTVADTAAFFAPGGRLSLSASLLDSLALGPVRLAVQAGVSHVDGDVAPVLALRAEAGAAFASLRTGRGASGRLWDAGLSGRIASPAALPDARVLAGDVGLAATVGAWRLDLRAFGARQDDARWLVSVGDTAYAVAGSSAPVQRVGATLGVGWRDDVARGLYVRGAATLSQALDADASPLHRRDADALPRAWGRLRVGLRAESVGANAADLDLALVAHGWSAFRSRVIEPSTGLLALADPDGVFGGVLPARGTLDAEATATFNDRATVFLRYENGLATRLYDGARLTQGEPIPSTLLRVGVFWALLD